MNFIFVLIIIIIIIIVTLLFIKHNYNIDTFNNVSKKIIHNEIGMIINHDITKKFNFEPMDLVFLKDIEVKSQMSLSFKLYETENGIKIFKKKTILEDDIRVLSLLEGNKGFVQLYAWTSKPINKHMIDKYYNENGNYAQKNIKNIDKIYNVYTYFVEGKTLHDSFNDSNLDKKHIIKTLFESSIYLYTLFQFSNRDMHGNNIIITTDGDPVIIDIMFSNEIFSEAMLFEKHLERFNMKKILELDKFYELFLNINSINHEDFYLHFKKYLTIDPIGYINWNSIESYQKKIINKEEPTKDEINNIFYQLWIRDRLMKYCFI